MFHNIPPAILTCMHRLEQADARDRQDGTPHLQRLRQIPAETGRLLALLAATAPPGAWLEIGASGGYSALWLALACQAAGRRLTTFEILPEKARLARQTFQQAQVEHLVSLVEGDARDHLPHCSEIAFCFLDAEKDIYHQIYELVIPRLVQGGLFLADNALSHLQELKLVLDQALADERVDALVIPVGKGVLVCRKV